MVQRATRLARREWRDLILAQALLLRAQAAVWLGGGRRPWQLTAVARDSGAAAQAELLPGEPTLEQWHRVIALERAMHRAIRYGVLRPRPKCLARAIALAALLRSAGIRGSCVRIGVQRTDKRSVAAHAWVELGGRVVGDRVEYVATFTPLADLGSLQKTRLPW
jgi:hypothetical protein